MCAKNTGTHSSKANQTKPNELKASYARATIHNLVTSNVFEAYGNQKYAVDSTTKTTKPTTTTTTAKSKIYSRRFGVSQIACAFAIYVDCLRNMFMHWLENELMTFWHSLFVLPYGFDSEGALLWRHSVHALYICMWESGCVVLIVCAMNTLQELRYHWINGNPKHVLYTYRIQSNLFAIGQLEPFFFPLNSWRSLSIDIQTKRSHWLIVDHYE